MQCPECGSILIRQGETMKCIACGYIMQTQQFDIQEKRKQILKKRYRKEYRRRVYSVNEKIERFKQLVNEKTENMEQNYQITETQKQQYQKQIDKMIQQLNEINDENYLQMLYLISKKWIQFKNKNNIEQKNILLFNFLSPQYFMKSSELAPGYLCWFSALNSGISLPLSFFAKKKLKHLYGQFQYMCGIYIDMKQCIKQFQPFVEQILQSHPLFKQLVFVNYEGNVDDLYQFYIKVDKYAYRNSYIKQQIDLNTILSINIFFTLVVMIQKQWWNIRPTKQQQIIQFQQNQLLNNIYSMYEENEEDEEDEEQEKTYLEKYLLENMQQYQKLIKDQQYEDYIVVDEQIEQITFEKERYHQQIYDIPCITFISQEISKLFLVSNHLVIIELAQKMYKDWLVTQLHTKDVVKQQWLSLIEQQMSNETIE